MNPTSNPLGEDANSTPTPNIKKDTKFKKGQRPWNYNRKGLQKHSQSTRDKMSQAHLGRPKSKQHKENIRLAKLAEKNPQFGNLPWNYKIPSTEETKAKVAEARLFQEITHDSKPEKITQQELQKRGIEFQKNIPIDGKPDIFLMPDTIIFIDGDFHHANPKLYSSNDRIIGIKIAKDIWDYDAGMTEAWQELGMKVYRFWASEIEKNVVMCIDVVLSGKYTTIKNRDGTKEIRHIETGELIIIT